ncbi:MAG: UDP-N-acetylmuramoylalanyl-D-glutamyl-2,6-diaminopimelate--D-alanyl-D-alanine ligase [Rhizobiaceae bacterium]|nr:UDP-N-acetylmuramoylalanyl-D-glutamyl-2,6-diaminopimelate--D-alanyl-D-alanine ligase [Rhizobiaceae bacterium]
MTYLWTSEDLVAAMDGRPTGPLPEGVTGISIDSRTLQPGEAFFAIKGETMDGHDFATAAMKAGASVLVIAEGRLPAVGRLSVPKIVVPDVLVALEKLGTAARARSRAKVVAVTGSVGKTTTKEALRHVLSSVGTVHASDKSFNNHWGVPLTLARLPADCDYAVFEIGMNHSGEIRPLTAMVKPHVAIITLIAAAHLGHFKNLEEIAQAKAEIFEGLEEGGTALLNRDDSHFKLLTKLSRHALASKVESFGENEGATYRLLDAKLDSNGSSIRAKVGDQEISARIGVPGRHIIQNCLAVLGVAHLVGADVEKAARALATLQAANGRGRRHMLQHPDGPFLLIDESYNANPASMRVALELLDAAPIGDDGRRIAVLGDMLELGAHAPKLHAALADILSGMKIDLVLLAGPEMKALRDKIGESLATEYRANVDELKSVLLNEIGPGDAVMIKSSNGIGFSKLVDLLLREYSAQPSGQKRA